MCTYLILPQLHKSHYRFYSLHLVHSFQSCELYFPFWWPENLDSFNIDEISTFSWPYFMLGVAHAVWSSERKSFCVYVITVSLQSFFMLALAGPFLRTIIWWAPIHKCFLESLNASIDVFVCSQSVAVCMTWIRYVMSCVYNNNTYSTVHLWQFSSVNVLYVPQYQPLGWVLTCQMFKKIGFCPDHTCTQTCTHTHMGELWT